MTLPGRCALYRDKCGYAGGPGGRVHISPPPPLFLGMCPAGGGGAFHSRGEASEITTSPLRLTSCSVSPSLLCSRGADRACVFLFSAQCSCFSSCRVPGAFSKVRFGTSGVAFCVIVHRRWCEDNRDRERHPYHFAKRTSPMPRGNPVSAPKRRVAVAVSCEMPAALYSTQLRPEGGGNVTAGNLALSPQQLCAVRARGLDRVCVSKTMSVVFRRTAVSSAPPALHRLNLFGYQGGRHAEAVV